MGMKSQNSQNNFEQKELNPKYCKLISMFTIKTESTGIKTDTYLNRTW